MTDPETVQEKFTSFFSGSSGVRTGTSFLYPHVRGFFLGDKKEGSLSQKACSPSKVIGNLHNYCGEHDEEDGSQPFVSAGVLCIEERNVSDCNRGDKAGK